MATATAAILEAAGRATSTGRRSIREIRVLHCDTDSEGPRPGDAVEVAGRMYLVVAGNGVDGSSGLDRGGHVFVQELATV